MILGGTNHDSGLATSAGAWAWQGLKGMRGVRAGNPHRWGMKGRRGVRAGNPHRIMRTFMGAWRAGWQPAPVLGRGGA